MKNQNGKTSIVLIIIIVLIIGMATILVRYLRGMIVVSKLQDLKTNMLIMQAETKKGLEKVCFQTANLNKENADDNAKIEQAKAENLIGIKLSDASEEVKESVSGLPQEVEIDDNCYYLDDETLEKIGIKDGHIMQYKYFIVKYDFTNTTAEIITTKGYNGNYTLTQIIQLAKDE